MMGKKGGERMSSERLYNVDVVLRALRDVMFIGVMQE